MPRVELYVLLTTNSAILLHRSIDLRVSACFQRLLVSDIFQ